MQPIDIDIRNEIIQCEGNIVISASAGTGKTHTTIEKIKHDINENNDYHTFAAITFTKKAAKEIDNRLALSKKDGFVGTNDHFVISEIIQPFMYDVYGREFKREIIPDYSNENSFKLYEEGIERIRSTGYLCKYEDTKKNFAFQLALYILEHSEAARLYLQSKYYRIYIDEYQDSDIDMHTLFLYIGKKISIPLFIVGDKKQSIYGWRGGYLKGFESLMSDADFNNFILLQNFRSNIQIQNYSNLFIDDVRANFQPCKNNNEIICFAYKDMSYAIKYIKDWIDTSKRSALLIRTRREATLWSQQQILKELLFTYIPASPLDNPDLESEHIWITRNLAFYLISEDYSEYDFYYEIPSSDSYNFNIIKNKLYDIENAISSKPDFINECIGLYNYFGYVQSSKVDKELNLLYDIACSEEFIPTYNSTKYDHVIMTIHGSKGLEFDQVIVLASDYNLYLDEDLYLHYVAVSRPKYRLLVLINTMSNYGKGYIKCLKDNIEKLQQLGSQVILKDLLTGINSEEFK